MFSWEQSISFTCSNSFFHPYQTGITGPPLRNGVSLEAQSTSCFCCQPVKNSQSPGKPQKMDSWLLICLEAQKLYITKQHKKKRQAVSPSCCQCTNGWGGHWNVSAVFQKYRDPRNLFWNSTSKNVELHFKMLQLSVRHATDSGHA